MGLTFIEGTVFTTAKKKKKASVTFLVDSGALYTLLPQQIWQALGLKPKRTMTFILADGTKVQRKLSECYVALPQGESHTPVILGEGGDEALLGTVTLEELGFLLDPFKRELQPMRAMLA